MIWWVAAPKQTEFGCARISSAGTHTSGSALKVPPSCGTSMETGIRQLGSTIGRTGVRDVLVRGRPDPGLFNSVSAVLTLGHAHTRL